MILMIGDVHGDFDSLLELEEQYKFCDCAIQVGDLSFYRNLPSAHADGKFLKHLPNTGYPVITDNPSLIKLPIKTYFVKGNHDDYDCPDSLEQYNIFYLKNGTHILNGKVIAVLGGIYSPKKFLEDPSNLKGRSRRFFTRLEIESLKTSAIRPYVLVTHQAASMALPKIKLHEGIAVLDELLQVINPQLYIYGHHHINYTCNINKISIVGLGALNYNKNSFIVI